VTCVHGAEIASGTGPTDQEDVQFVAPETGYFTIEVRNLGDVWNEYVLTVR
jgi:hypothetical protein